MSEPKVFKKNVPTGKGFAPKTPGNADSSGQSNHVPQMGKPAPGSADYASEQQQA